MLNIIYTANVRKSPEILSHATSSLSTSAHNAALVKFEASLIALEEGMNEYAGEPEAMGDIIAREPSGDLQTGRRASDVMES